MKSAAARAPLRLRARGAMETLVQGGKYGATLDVPKGMAVHGDTLWVADIDALRGLDPHSGAPLATIDLRPQHAVLLIAPRAVVAH